MTVTERIRDIVQNILQHYFQTGNGSSSTYFHIVLFMALFEKYTKYANYTMHYLYNYNMRNDNNNKVTDNNYGRCQDFILLLNIPMGSRKNFFVIYRQVAHAPSKRFASRVLGAFAP